MRKKNRDYMNSAAELADEMIRIAAQGEHDCKDDTCFLIYGVIRDCAYNIRRILEQESSHKPYPKG